MRKSGGKKPYLTPKITSEKVFEQAALSCVVAAIVTGNPPVHVNSDNLKISYGSSGCGYTSS
ncbi:MAG: hypothetical protein GXP25_07505 [Planctomycetes bacterium]|nr:hypothetical protein [Planctomycetota bacterium]